MEEARQTSIFDDGLFGFGKAEENLFPGMEKKSPEKKTGKADVKVTRNLDGRGGWQIRFSLAGRAAELASVHPYIAASDILAKPWRIYLLFTDDQPNSKIVKKLRNYGSSPYFCISTEKERDLLYRHLYVGKCFSLKYDSEKKMNYITIEEE